MISYGTSSRKGSWLLSSEVPSWYHPPVDRKHPVYAINYHQGRLNVTSSLTSSPFAFEIVSLKVYLNRHVLVSAGLNGRFSSLLFFPADAQEYIIRNRQVLDRRGVDHRQGCLNPTVFSAGVGDRSHIRRSPCCPFVECPLPKTPIH